MRFEDMAQKKSNWKNSQKANKKGKPHKGGKKLVRGRKM